MKKLLLYGANGFINTAVTYGLYLLLIKVLDYRVAAVLVYAFGICLSYWVNGAIVFRARGQFVSFVFLYIGLLLLNLVITWLLVERYAWSKVIAPLPAIAVVLVLGFVINKHVIFRQSPASGSRGQ